ncbi:MAG TPA: hypothetical protein VJJ82_00005, partial [Candidatus Nanoarchaeia archaeon]|nr:hypothetical protein [Candidatus Nanoarchaeia archaeon]
SDEQINWDYVKAFKQAHGEDGGYSIVARSNYLGTLTGIKLICTPGVISPEVAQKHAQGRIQDLPYTNVYPCAATNVLAPTHGRAA